MSNIGKVVDLKFTTAQDKNGNSYKKYEFTLNGKVYKTSKFNVFGGKRDLYEGMPVIVSEVKKGEFTNIVVEDAPAGAEIPEPTAASVKPSPRAENASKTQATFGSDARNDAIEAQSSRKDAIALLELAFESGALAKTKFTGKGDGERALLGLVEHFTKELFDLGRRVARNEKSPFEGVAPKAAQDDPFPPSEEAPFTGGVATPKKKKTKTVEVEVEDEDEIE